MKLSQLEFDPEFQSKIPPLQFKEEQQLEQNVVPEGRLLNPVITSMATFWMGTPATAS